MNENGSGPPTSTIALESLAGPMLRAADAARIGVSVVFLDQVPNLAQIAYINDAGVELLGYPREEILRSPAARFMSPEEQERRADQLTRRLRGEPVPRVFETEVVTGTGRRVPLEVSLSPVPLDGRPALVSFFVDVTERRRALEALARSEWRFRHIIERAPEAVWIFDGMSLRYVNATALRIFGYPPEGAEQMRLTDLVHPDDQPTLFARARRVLDGETLPPQEYRGFHRAGHIVTVEVSSIRIDWEGRVMLLAFGRDVSVRKALDTQLAQAARLAALGRLTAGIAHELNNPLAYALLGLEQAAATADELGDRSARAEELRRRLAEVRDGIERASDMVRQLRAFSRSEPGEDRALVELDAVVTAAVRLVHNELRHRARVVHDTKGAPRVLGNAGRLEQVFVNLLTAAGHCLPDGRSGNLIEINVGHDPSGAAVVEVADNGTGIPPDVLPHVFDPFAWGPGDSRGGLTRDERALWPGLGLSIGHQIIASHGGQLTVTSAPGRTVFRVVLPAAPAAAEPAVTATRARHAPAVARSRPAHARNAERRRALIIDDEPMIAEMLARMLSERYDVSTANDGRRALERITSGETYDLVLCDLMMPEMTGMDVYERTCDLAPALADRFVFMTGGAFSARAEQFLADTANPCIEKPFTIGRLLEVLEPIG